MGLCRKWLVITIILVFIISPLVYLNLKYSENQFSSSKIVKCYKIIDLVSKVIWILLTSKNEYCNILSVLLFFKYSIINKSINSVLKKIRRSIWIISKKQRNLYEKSGSEDGSCVWRFCGNWDDLRSSSSYLCAGYTDERGEHNTHNPKVQFNEEVCPIEVSCLAHCATQWLKNHQ